MQKAGSNPRRNILKIVPLAIFSIGAFSFFRIKKSKDNPEMKFKTLSKSEADEIIKNEKFSFSGQHKPAPAPHAQKKIKG